jgi:F-type H+-transporting ATPase subunit epsilon
MATATHEPAAASSASRTATGRLQCVVVTPEKTLFDLRVDFVALPLFDGELGVLPGRAPLIGRLGYGELRTRTGETTSHYFVEGGFAQVRDDVVTVLTHRAIPVADLHRVDTRGDLDRARALKAFSDAEMVEKVKALARARAQLRLTRRR